MNKFVIIIFLALAACSGKEPIQANPEQFANYYALQAQFYAERGQYLKALRNINGARTCYAGVDNQLAGRKLLSNAVQTALLLNLTDYAVALNDDYKRKLKLAGLSLARAHLYSSAIAIQKKDWLAAEEALRAIDSDIVAVQQNVQYKQLLIAIRSNKPETVEFESALLNISNTTVLEQANFNYLNAEYQSSVDKQEAEKHYLSALSLYKNAAYKPGIASSLLANARLFLEEDKDKAEDYLVRALHVYLDFGNLYKGKEIIDLLRKISSGEALHRSIGIDAKNKLPILEQQIKSLNLPVSC